MSKPDSDDQGRRRRAPRASLQDSGDAGQGETEDWVFTYMDVITLLVTLFVVLLSFASFDGQGRHAPPAPKTTVTDKGTPGALQDDKGTGGPTQMDLATRALAAVVASLGQRGDVRIETMNGRTALRLGERVLFPEGSARLSVGGRAMLRRFLPVLRTSKLHIAVEGHTDPTPIATERFHSNWELSALRATTVVRMLLRNGIDANRLSARAYAATRPVASNATAAGRARNRRVTLVLQPNDD